MSGITLSSETEFSETRGRWLGSYNMVCVVISIVAFIATAAKGRTGVGGALFFAIVVYGSSFLVKQEVAKMKQRRLWSCIFTLNSTLTAEEIGQKAAYFLLEKGIQTDITDEAVTFKGKNAIYTLDLNQAGNCFSLDWGYPLGKLFSPMRWQYIADYKETLSEIGTIAYCIQQL